MMDISQESKASERVAKHGSLIRRHLVQPSEKGPEMGRMKKATWIENYEDGTAMTALDQGLNE